jgi:hypothetical protein
MSLPKPPFYSFTEELLYNIYLKLSAPSNALTISDINTFAKLNAIIADVDLATSENLVNSIGTLRGNVPVVANTLEKLYNIIQALNYLKREDIDTLAEINSLLVDADLVKTEDLTNAITNLNSKARIAPFYFDGDDDEHCDSNEILIFRGKIELLTQDLTHELASVTYKTRLDASNIWVTHSNLVALQTWINQFITGDQNTGAKYWIKCQAVYKHGKTGRAANIFGYMTA